MERGQALFHYQITYDLPRIGDGRRRQRMKRAWLPDDAAAEVLERELIGDVPADALTWRDAWDRWRTEHAGKRSDVHFRNVKRDVDRLLRRFGEKATVEGTTLADYTAWLADVAAGSPTGRPGHIAHSSTMVLARWAESRELVTSIPFRAARPPEVKLAKRGPAAVDEFGLVLAALTEDRQEMSSVWSLVGYTGMRIGAACDLMEADIDEPGRRFTVTTKGAAIRDRARVVYPITPEIAALFARARTKTERALKSARLFVNRKGNGWTPETFNQSLKRVRDRCRAEEKENTLPAGTKWPAGTITPHRLRHMVETLLAK